VLNTGIPQLDLLTNATKFLQAPAPNNARDENPNDLEHKLTKNGKKPAIKQKMITHLFKLIKSSVYCMKLNNLSIYPTKFSRLHSSKPSTPPNMTTHSIFSRPTSTSNHHLIVLSLYRSHGSFMPKCPYIFSLDWRMAPYM